MEKDRFISQLNDMNIQTDDILLDRLQKYLELLISWNEKINLTAITEENEVYTKHFADSLSIAIIKDEIKENLGKDIFKDEIMLADIGTGAGFPGLVIAIAFPNIKVTLVDSLNKRIDFLNEVIKTLDLENVRTFHSRAEDFAKDKDHRESYDIVVSRAVARLNLLSEYSIPFIRSGGLFLPYKAGDSDEEINEAQNALDILGGKLIIKKDFILPKTDLKRTIPIIKKIADTPEKYPRPKASKKPL